jgi:hypothetical protein
VAKWNQTDAQAEMNWVNQSTSTQSPELSVESEILVGSAFPEKKAGKLLGGLVSISQRNQIMLLL